MDNKLLKKAAKFGVVAEEIYEDEKGNLVFFASALNKIVAATTDNIKSFAANFVKFDVVPLTEKVFALSEAEVVLKDGTTKKVTGVCLVGSRFPDGTEVDEEKATYLATTRAIRTALRAVNFDPIAAIENGSIILNPRSAENYRKSIHAIKNQVKMSDKVYRSLLKILTGKDSTKHMTEDEMSKVAAHFQGLVKI